MLSYPYPTYREWSDSRRVGTAMNEEVLKFINEAMDECASDDGMPGREPKVYLGTAKEMARDAVRMALEIAEETERDDSMEEQDYRHLEMIERRRLACELVTMKIEHSTPRNEVEALAVNAVELIDMVEKLLEDRE